MAAATWRQTKAGEWVVFGAPEVVRVGVVSVVKRSGETKTVSVERVGKTFATADGERVYGYIAKSGWDTPLPCRARPVGMAAGRRRHCITDGNCSSFGNGRSCGAYDCDGYE